MPQVEELPIFWFHDRAGLRSNCIESFEAMELKVTAA
jgi:hypothetical protein